MWTFLLLVHGLLAVALLGAITHQTLSLWLPAARPAAGIAQRFRAVPGGAYVDAVIVLYVLTFVLGGFIYTEYRVSIRVVLEQMEAWTENGLFEMKEHCAALGLALLPAYRHYWRAPPEAHPRARRALTALVACAVWWCFLAGQIVNNVRGFGA